MRRRVRVPARVTSNPEGKQDSFLSRTLVAGPELMMRSTSGKYRLVRLCQRTRVNEKKFLLKICNFRVLLQRFAGEREKGNKEARGNVRLAWKTTAFEDHPQCHAQLGMVSRSGERECSHATERRGTDGNLEK